MALLTISRPVAPVAPNTRILISSLRRCGDGWGSIDEPLAEEVTDDVYRLLCRDKAAEGRLEDMRHALPHRQRHLHTCRPRTVGIADGVRAQHFVVSDIDADRRQAVEFRMERRGLGVRGILALK